MLSLTLQIGLDLFENKHRMISKIGCYFASNYCCTCACIHFIPRFKDGCIVMNLMLCYNVDNCVLAGNSASVRHHKQVVV